MSVLFLEHQPNGPANPCEGVAPPALWLSLHPLEYIVACLYSNCTVLIVRLAYTKNRSIKA